jgi:hypothetical protein
MKTGILFCSLALLLPNAFGQTRPALSLQHLFYFDSSGSMKDRVGPPGTSSRRALADRLFTTTSIFGPSHTTRAFRFTTRVMPVSGIPANAKPGSLVSFVRTEWSITSEDTDLVRVLDDATTAANSQPGRVTFAWILTDNANDPTGKGADVANTKAFYEKLFQTPTIIQRLYFFPIPELQLVQYLLVMSKDAGLDGMDVDDLENALAAYGRGVKAPRIRAKPVGGKMPLEIDPRIGFEGSDEKILAQVLGKGLHAQLVIDGLKEGTPLNGVFRLKLRSRFEEWRIEQATIQRVALECLESSDFPSMSSQLSARLTPSGITVDPRGASSVVYSLELGAVDTPLRARAPFFYWPAFSPGGIGTVRGRLALRIGDPKLKLKILNEPALTQAVKQVFHLEDIEYFVPKAVTSEALRLDFSTPVEIHVAYQWWTRWLVAALLILIVLSIAHFVFGNAPKSLMIRIQGYSESPVVLSKRDAYRLAPGGLAVAELRLTRTGLVCAPLAPASVNGRTKPLPLKRGGPIQITRESESYRYVVPE